MRRGPAENARSAASRPPNSGSVAPAGDLLTLNHNLALGANDAHYTFQYTPAHELYTEHITDPDYLWQPAAGFPTSYGAANALNQYPSYTAGLATRVLGYDGKGNLASGNLDGTAAWLFGYDAENRMLTACKPYVSASGNCPSPTVNAAYAYGPLGRRVHKSGLGVSETFFYDDGDDEIAEYDGAKNPKAIYIPGPAIDEPVATVTGFGATLAHEYFHTNHQGSVVAMSGDDASLAEGPFTYDPYGNCFQGSTPCAALAGSVPYKFTGRRLDPETGLYYYRARCYAPTLGRFCQTDPVGYSADLNLYTYVGNDPVSRIDPRGLCDPSEGPCIDYTPAQTTWYLNRAYGEATAGERQGWYTIEANSGRGGSYDFAYRQPHNTFAYEGRQMSAGQMGNFMAGFEGAAYDKAFPDAFPSAETMVEGAGYVFHLTGDTQAKSDPFDRTGMPDIKRGEAVGQKFKPMKQGPFPGPLHITRYSPKTSSSGVSFQNKGDNPSQSHLCTGSRMSTKTSCDSQ